MHSKTHFKSLFKSAKISTVSAKIIFLLNTTLPSEHYKIYFINLEATKLEIWKSQNNEKSGIKWPILSLTVADSRAPFASWTHTSATWKQSIYVARRWRGQSSPTANLPAVTSSQHDLRDLAHRLSYVGGLLVGASNYGGGYGGTAGRNDGSTLEEATVKQAQARTSILPKANLTR